MSRRRRSIATVPKHPSVVHPTLAGAMLAGALLAGPVAAGPLDDALAPSGDVRLEGSVRARFETLDGDFRAAPGSLDGIVALRTILRAEIDRGPLEGALELMDSRAFAHDDEDLVGTGFVNVAEPVDAWLGWSTGDEATRVRLRAGRLAEDLGSRRLVARNVYRNTTNVFDGVEVLVTQGEHRYRAFLWSPTDRRPAEGERIGDHDFEFDESDPERHLLGVFAERALGDGDRLEAYVLHLDEAPAAETGSADRRITTPGFRWLRPPAADRWDFEIEAAAQFGEQRTATGDLDVRAGFAHLEIGRRLAGALAPRPFLALDWASGDDDPTDDEAGRFSPLFGAPVGDTGPTGIYNALPRENLLALTAGVEFRRPGLDGYLKVRRSWLAERRDAWVGARLRDPAGDSGRALGNQLEARIRWWPVGDALRLVGGLSLLDRDDFGEDAPGAPDDGLVTYLWTGAMLRF